MRQPRNPTLDGLRGLAILLVIVWHYFANAQGPSPGSTLAYAQALLRLSWSGVDLFFVLSGFLIGGILLDARDSPNYFKTFYVRRFFRILPLYYFVLAVSLLASARVGEHSGFHLTAPWYAYATFAQNFWMAKTGDFGAHWMDVTWSLAVEEQFYLTLPLVIRYVSPRKLPFVLGACIVAAPLLRSALYLSLDHGGVAAYVLMLCRVDALLIGVLLAWAQRRGWRSGAHALYAAFAICCAGMAAMLAARQGIGSPAMSTVGYTVVAFTYACLLLLAINHWQKLFSVKLLTSAGVLAYGLYLFHLNLLGLVVGEARLASLSDLALTLAVSSLTFALAALSWHYFEKPLVDKGHENTYHN